MRNSFKLKPWDRALMAGLDADDEFVAVTTGVSFDRLDLEYFEAALGARIERLEAMRDDVREAVERAV
jgi:hypothetical protein